MTKIVYNACFGGFGLSPAATLRLYALGCTEIATPVDEYWPPESRKEEKSSSLGYEHSLRKWREYVAVGAGSKRNLFLTIFSPDENFVLYARYVKRTDPRLLQVIEELGGAANGDCAKLAIAEVPDGTRYRIDEYDGSESVMTVDDYEWSLA